MEYPTIMEKIMTKLRDLFDDLFGTPSKELARNTDPDTSHRAASSVDSTKLEMLVYEVVAQHPNGCIADDVVNALPHLRAHTIIPRFAPLMRKGFIYDTGERRKAVSGRSQRVIKITGNK